MNKDKKTDEELLEDIRREWMNFAQNSFVGEKFKLTNGNSVSSRNITKDKINKYLENPVASYQNLQQASEYFLNNSGIYYRLIKTLPIILTYDYSIYPFAEPSKLEENKDKIIEAYSIASLYLDKINVKKFARMVGKDLFENGEGFYYKIEDNAGIIYQKIPNKYCLPFLNENGVWRYVIDLSKIGSEDLTSYPIEIQKAYELYKNDSKNPIFLLGKYYFIKDGICFTFSEKAEHSFPPFSFMFNDLIELDEKKELKSQIDKVENSKMIHNKIDISNPETAVDPKTARKYNEAIKANLKNKGLDSVFSITNPFEAQILSLKSKSDSNDTLITKAVTQAMTEAGITEMLYNSEKGGAEALKKSIITLSSLCINIICDKLVDYINYELSNLKGNVKMAMKLYENSTIYNQDELRSKSRENLAYGGSRLEFMALGGYTPLQGYNQLKMESMLNIDSLFIPIETSHTQSGDSNTTKKTASEIVDSGGSIAETTEQQEDKS